MKKLVLLGALAAGGIAAARALDNLDKHKKITENKDFRLIPENEKKYHLRDHQNFSGDDNLNTGAMVGWAPTTIISLQLCRMPWQIGDIIRVYNYLNDGTLIIDRLAVIIGSNANVPGYDGAHDTIYCDRPLWGGNDRNIDKQSRLKQSNFGSPQSETDGRIWHVFVEHVGYASDEYLSRFELNKRILLAGLVKSADSLPFYQ